MENKFTDICTFEVLYKAYLAARRGKRSRAATAHYEVHLLENIVNLLAVNIYLYQPLMGLVILLAIVLEAYKNRKL